MADIVRGLSLTELHSRYGQPNEVWRSPARPNLVVYAWKMGAAETDMFVAKAVVHSIDGAAKNLDLGDPQVHTRASLELLKSKLALSSG